MTTNSKFNSEKRRRNELFLGELIERAESGDSVAAREVLDEIASDLIAKGLRPALMEYLAKNLLLHLDHDVPLLKALGLEAPPKPVGRPLKYDEVEVAAVDLLLRDHAGYRPEAAASWITSELGPDRRAVQRIRVRFDSRYAKEGDRSLMNGIKKDDLLYLSGSMREKVGRLFPQP